MGKSDLTVSEIGFGCMSLGISHQDNANLLHSAFDKGINFFNTADLYDQGSNEETTGKAFAISDILFSQLTKYPESKKAADRNGLLLFMLLCGLYLPQGQGRYI
ncbi:aldo/keto reductase [Pontibacter aquaedesilientis]|uniref:aldo/keto reductase n=1 Tax=Pontibacter aquaedesilientis TaxID=2766980 RepID=UPI001CD11AC7|nr:aldo/keto reductase [Pontibacter aquaedesilientis]